MGRRKKTDTEPKTKRSVRPIAGKLFTWRLTEAERKALGEKAKAAGHKSVSTYLTELVGL